MASIQTSKQTIKNALKGCREKRKGINRKEISKAKPGGRGYNTYRWKKTKWAITGEDNGSPTTPAAKNAEKNGPKKQSAEYDPSSTLVSDIIHHPDTDILRPDTDILRPDTDNNSGSFLL